MRKCRAASKGLKRAYLLMFLAALAMLMEGTCWAQTRLLLATSAVAYDAQGNLYIADARQHRVFEATLAGTLLPVAGTGVQGFAGDGGPAVAAELNQPQGLAFGTDGTLYIADTGNQRVRAVRPDGTIATAVGTGVAGAARDGSAALSAPLRQPTALAVDGSGDLLICDSGNHRVWRVGAGVLRSVAGIGVQGFAGDGGPATAAQLDTPSGIAVNADGRIFVADTHNHRVRQVDSEGVISTYAGSGQRGFGGDVAQARLAMFAEPRGLAVTSDGGLLVADSNNQRVRKIDPTGVITTEIGNGLEGRAADGTQGLFAPLDIPRSVAQSTFGLPVAADTRNGGVQVLVSTGAVYAPAPFAPQRTSAISTSATSAWTYGHGSLPVSVSGVAGPALGQLRAMENGVEVGHGALTLGAGAMDLSKLSAGSHQLGLHYVGDGLNPSADVVSTSAAVAQAPVLAVAAEASLFYGEPIQALSGTLSGVLPADASLVQVSFGVSGGDMPPVGTYPISATLTGPKAANYVLSPGQGSGSLTVIKARSIASLNAAAQVYPNVPVTLTATVASSTRGQPTGTLQLLDSGMVVGSAALSGGTATFAYLPPAQGARMLSVQYPGDDNFLPSLSAASAVTVSALPDFVLAVAGEGAASASAGGLASFAVTVRSQSAPFTGAVALSLTGLPAGATATFSPPQVVPDTGAPTVSIAVQTAQASQQAAMAANSSARVSYAALAAAVLLMRRRRLRLRGGLACLLLPLFFLTGCGARSVGEGLGEVVSKSYALQLTATGTNLAGAVVVHSVPLTLTISQ